MGLKSTNSRFKLNNYSYPLQFITFEREKTLGFFDPDYLQIGIHRHFLFSRDKELLVNVLRHELAHYLIHIKHGPSVDAHGVEFRTLCKGFNYDKIVYSATYDDYSGEIITQANTDKSQLIEKVKKLLRLSESSNPHEAELALTKANQLLLKHQLSPVSESTSEAEFHIKILVEGKRVSTKYQAISEILQHFFVKVIFNHGKGHYRLEAFGLPHQVDFAQYVFHYLDQEIESLWIKNKSTHMLKGKVARNSFIWGLSEGFISKIKSAQLPSVSQSQALTLFDEHLTKSFYQHYRSKRFSKTSGKVDGASKKLGQKAGSKLVINKPIDKSKNKKTYLIN